MLLLFSRCHKKESDLANALVQWRSVESALISKEAENRKLLSEERSLNDAFADLQSQLKNVSRIVEFTVLLFTPLCVCLCVDGGCSVRCKEPAHV